MQECNEVFERQNGKCDGNGHGNGLGNKRNKGHLDGRGRIDSQGRGLACGIRDGKGLGRGKEKFNSGELDDANSDIVESTITTDRQYEGYGRRGNKRHQVNRGLACRNADSSSERGDGRRGGRTHSRNTQGAGCGNGNRAKGMGRGKR